jgi:hypothetical protein
MVGKTDQNPDRGRITLSGFRRPDMLKKFRRVTVMSGLFQHTMLHAVWRQLGVKFRPSDIVRLQVPTTSLGKRRLRIYWLSSEGWSKRSRGRYRRDLQAHREVRCDRLALHGLRVHEQRRCERR